MHEQRGLTENKAKQGILIEVSCMCVATWR